MWPLLPHKRGAATRAPLARVDQKWIERAHRHSRGSGNPEEARVAAVAPGPPLLRGDDIIRRCQDWPHVGAGSQNRTLSGMFVAPALSRYFLMRASV